MITESCIGPYTSLQQRIIDDTWKSFYEKLIKRDKDSLDKVIRSVEYVISAMTKDPNEELDKKWVEELLKDMSSKEIITKLKINSHLQSYVEDKGREYGIKDVFELKRFYWNSVNDILRCLKKIRNDEAPFIPCKDYQLTHGFVERLSMP